MTQEEIIRKLSFYIDDEIYHCDVGIRVCAPSDISSGRSYYGGKWSVLQRAQAIQDLNALKTTLVSWKQRYREQYDNVRSNGIVIEYNNEKEKLRGKIEACDNLTEYISELEKRGTE